MDLNEALSQISEIRQQMARSEVFRGYRSLTVGFSGLMGIVGAVIQPQWVADPQQELARYLVLWISLAAICLLVAGLELFYRWRQAGPGLSREMTQVAIEHFVPCIVVGALITLCIARSSPEVSWMLPGLWCFVFALGVFASCRCLPRCIGWVALYFVICGCVGLVWTQGNNAFSPWFMAVSFGGGQLIAAVMLYWTLERTRVTSEG